MVLFFVAVYLSVGIVLAVFAMRRGSQLLHVALVVPMWPLMAPSLLDHTSVLGPTPSVPDNHHSLSFITSSAPDGSDNVAPAAYGVPLICVTVSVSASRPPS